MSDAGLFSRVCVPTLDTHSAYTGTEHTQQPVLTPLLPSHYEQHCSCSHCSGICCICCAAQLHRKLEVYSTKEPLTLKLGFLTCALLQWTIGREADNGEEAGTNRVRRIALGALAVTNSLTLALLERSC